MVRVLRGQIVTIADMMGDRAEFKKRRGPLSAITKSKIAQALRGKRKPKSSLGGHIRKGAKYGALAGLGLVGTALGAEALVRSKGITPTKRVTPKMALGAPTETALAGGALGAGIYGAKKLKDRLTGKKKRRQ